MIPIFKSHHSYGRSILTIEDEPDIISGKPVSIIAICKKHGIKDLYLAESSMSGFAQVNKHCIKNDLNLRFGYELICCRDNSDKTDESPRTESKVIVWLKDGGGYADLCKFYTQSNTDGFHNYARCDYKSLSSLNRDYFSVSIPFYDSFIHKNILGDGKCVPEFGDMELTFHIENHNLPFDFIIKDAVLKYIEGSGHKTIDSHKILYYNNSDAEAYQIFRCISNRSKLSKPDLEHFCSREFSFESFKCKSGI
jgi:DNA polymerase III alpha subunit